MERRDALDKMIANRTLSVSGANWIRKALDPYHDFEVRIDGLPDEDTSRVVIQEVPLTQTFAVPSGVAGNWDMHVFTLPEMANIWANPPKAVVVGGNGVYYTNVTQPQPASGNYQFGLVNVFSTGAGGATTPNGTAFGPGSVNAVFDFSAYMSGQKRLIALAFEVHDTTAELYKQGSVVCYRMPQVEQVIGACPSANGGTIFGNSLGVVSRCPPATQAEAFLMPGSRQWEAREGAYCVAVMDAKANDLTGTVTGCRIFTRGDLGINGTGGSQFGFATIPTTSGAASPAFIQGDGFKPTPFHTAGAYFAGLSVNATLTVTCKAIFETCPTPENAQLVVLSKPSPDYDPASLEIYKGAASGLPVGVPVGMNASGDFWDSVLDIIGEVAPTIGSMIPLPGAGLLGNMAGKGAKIAQQARNKNEAPASDRKQVSNNFNANGNKNLAKPQGKAGGLPKKR